MAVYDRQDNCITIRVSHRSERQGIINVINSVAAERRHLQTDRYCSTPIWEQALYEGVNTDAGLLLLVAETTQQVVGFGRLTPIDEHVEARSIGNIGLALLSPYRCVGIGSRLLENLIAWAPSLHYRKLTAVILATNVHSQNLFRKFGFLVANQRKIRLPHQAYQSVDELLYELDISSQEVPCCTQHQPRF